MLLFFLIAPLCILLVYLNLSKSFSLFGSSKQKDFPTKYGVDVSFPIHHYIDASRFPLYASHYQDFIEGCYKYGSKRECDSTEFGRLEMNKEQPANQHNYTEIGFAKTVVPLAAWEPLISFYRANLHKEKPEKWVAGNTYVNHWVANPTMISFEDSSLRGGIHVKQLIWDAVQPIIEEWVGYKVEPTSLYGIRVYKRGSMLAPHVDRLPLVSSAIIQVAQDLDSPWPIEVYDHAGFAHNVTMLPGDMVLYESHTVLHGRPFPLNGTFYANVFVHFKPLEHNALNAQDQAQRDEEKEDDRKFYFFGKGYERGDGGVGGHEQSNLSPNRLDEMRRIFDRVGSSKPTASPTAESEEEPEDEAGDEELEEVDLADSVAEQWSELMEAARNDDVDMVDKLLEANPELLAMMDENKWTVLHEAIRAGSTQTVELLLKDGADDRSHVRGGGGALEVAEAFLPSDHEVIRLLKDHLEHGN
jgi:hypothetical protein